MARMLGIALAFISPGSLPWGLGLRILVEGTCPSAAAVETQLQPMLPSGASLSGLSARIEPLDDLLRVEVRGETGALLSVLDLPRSLPCPALASGAAVAIASAVASLPRSTPLLVATPPGRPTPPPPPPPPPRVLWSLGVAGGLAMTQQAITGGGSLELQLAPYSPRLGGRLGIQISATAMGMRRLPITADSPSGDELIQGSADFTRLSLTIAPRYRLWRDWPLVEVHAGPVLGAAIVEGSGFVVSYRSRALDVGIAGGLRVGRALTRFALWSQLGFVGWLRPQELALSGMAPSARLPAWDILLSVGLGFGRFQP